ncbi:MAG: hypothetical protein AB1690_09110 [Candidatus Zixiibacteriota bacterium]
MPEIRDKKKSGFYIGVTCPACGADLEIQENFFVLTCHHCGSAMRIAMPDTPPAFIIRSKFGPVEARFHLDRHCKQNNLPLISSGLSLQGIYYPYWKANAILLKIRNRIEERPVASENDCEQERTVPVKKSEITLSPFSATFGAGHPDNVVPYSLGMRTDYLKMLPCSQENIEKEFRCLSVLKNWTEIENNLQKNINGISSVSQADFGKNRTEYFHPRGSLVYFPYYIAEDEIAGNQTRFVIDGITGRATSGSMNDNEISQSASKDAVLDFGRLTVEPHRCTSCGIDLPKEESLVYFCRNCQRLILLEKNDLLKSCLYRTVNSNKKEGRFFPFWSFRLSDSQRKEMQILFGGIYQSEFLVVPAFRIANFEAMYRLSKRISSALPRIALQEIDNSSSDYGSVNVGPGEASALAEIIIYRERLSRFGPAQSPPPKFIPQEIFLFYAPFHVENYFYVDSVLNAVTFEKSLA